jgi:hypothetical protein
MITNIPIVGGTKDVAWDLVSDLKPDIVLLDQEENPLEMAEECPLPILTTHVNSLETLQTELMKSSLVEAMSTVNLRVPLGTFACIVRGNAPVAGTTTAFVMS